LGISGRDIGHRRVPEPPDNITGTIVLTLMYPPLATGPTADARTVQMGPESRRNPAIP
jgi:hypothetical protein